MKEFIIFGFVLATYILTGSLGQEASSNQNEGEIQMSISVQSNDEDSNETSPTTHAPHSTRPHVGVWRPSGRARGVGRRLPNHDGSNTLANGPLDRRYTARGRRYRARGRRLPVSSTGRPRTHHRHHHRTNSTESRISRRRHHQIGNGRLVATGSHTISPGSRRPGGGVDPFQALQNGRRPTGPFQDRQTAYDFLSNGGNSFRRRTAQQRERQAENARMASVMCGVFGKQFIPSAIGGRCVDPA